MDDSAGVIYRLEQARTRCARGRGRRRGAEMTFREAVEINTRLHGGEAVPTSQRMALAWYLTERIDAGDAGDRELIAMLFMAEHVRPELDEVWSCGRHGGSLRCGV